LHKIKIEGLHNADRIPIENTGRPWIYASYYRGLEKMNFDLRAEASWVSRASGSPPAIDGLLDDPCWREAKPLMFTSSAPVL
jgi:hypothetical protein